MTYNLFRSFLVALLVPLTFACTGLGIFVANAAEMTGTLSTLMTPLCVLVGLVTLCLFLLQLPFVLLKNKKWFVGINAVLFACGFLLWFQANVFNWNFGQLDGSGVNWSEFRHLMWLEIIVYVTVFGLVIWKRQWFSQYAVHFACLLIFMQMVPLARPVTKEWFPRGTWKQYEITYEGFFDYSQKQNVVFILPDTFYSQLFQRMTKKHPETLEWFSDFNYFPKQKSISDRTSVIVPQMLTVFDVESLPGYNIWTGLRGVKGGRPKTFSYPLLWSSEGALQKTLTESGFQTRLYASMRHPHHWDPLWISNIRTKSTSPVPSPRWRDRIEPGVGPIIDLAVVRSVPIVCKPTDIEQFGPVQSFFQQDAAPTASFHPIKDGERLKQIINRSPATAKSEKPVLNVIHFRGVHRPYHFNEDYEKEVMPGIEGEERQALGALRLIKRLLDEMKTAGVYDNSVIIIAGDHGNYPQYAADLTDLSHLHNPLLLVKRQGERHGEIVYRDEYTNVQDITPTILNLVGLENLPGRFSIFDIPPDVAEQRKKEYELFWLEQRNDDGKRGLKGNEKLQTAKMALKEKTVRLDISSEISLRRAELHVDENRLRWFVGDNPNVWNKQCGRRNAVLVMSSTDEKAGLSYRAEVHLRDRSGNRITEYWVCMGIIDVKEVPDGEYVVKFLLPQTDGTYAECVLPGTVAIVSGIPDVIDNKH